MHADYPIGRHRYVGSGVGTVGGLHPFAGARRLKFACGGADIH
jgi:hypothetical protein